jgi:hypothetical protein
MTPADRSRTPRVCLSLLLALRVPVSCGYFDPLHPRDTTPVDTSVSWERSIGGAGEDCATSVQALADGGFAFAGWTNSAGANGFDLWLVRLDSSGNTLWEKTYGGAGDQKGYSVIRTADGGFALAGSTATGGVETTDMYLVKVDAAGNETGSWTYGGSMEDRAQCVIEASDGGFVLAGSGYSAVQGNTDAYVVKTGPVPWSKTYGGSFEDIANCIRQTIDGGFVIAGSFGADNAEDTDAWLLKTDSAGNQAWSRTYGIEYPDSASRVELTPDGGYALTGNTRSWGVGDFDAWLIKASADGTEEWNRTYGGEAYDRTECILVPPGGGFLLAGMTRSVSNYCQAWLIRTDGSGSVQWNRTFGGNGDEWGYSVQPTADGGFLMAGSTTSGPGDINAYLVYFRP